MEEIPVLVGKGKARTYVNILDRLDEKYIEIVNNTVSSKSYTVSDGDNLPNISWKFYQTTTLWWIIARVNGIVDPLSIKSGDILRIPDFNSINTNVSVSNTSNIGTVTTL
jgi:nucleoid-associated protein YgaU